MADKKQLFYGVTQDFLEEQERRERLRVQEEKRLEQLRSQEAEIRAKAEEQKRKNDERKRAYFNYINFRPTDEKRERNSLKDVIVGVGVFIGVWTAINLFGLGVPEKRYGDYVEDGDEKVTFKQRVRDAFWPISNGWIVDRESDYVVGGQVIEGEHFYRYSKEEKGKFP